MKNLRLISVVSALAFSLCPFVSADTPPVAASGPKQSAGQTAEAKIRDLLRQMTLEEKAGQMTQAERESISANDVKTYRLGSILSGGGSAPPDKSPKGWAAMYDAFQHTALETRLKIPIIYGIDAVHGHNNVSGATIFPHNIGLGATRDPRLVEQVCRITALEVAATGLNWTFSPCITVPRDVRWGRTYEGFGETPELQRLFAPAAVSRIVRMKFAIGLFDRPFADRSHIDTIGCPTRSRKARGKGKRRCLNTDSGCGTKSLYCDRDYRSLSVTEPVEATGKTRLHHD